MTSIYELFQKLKVHKSNILYTSRNRFIKHYIEHETEALSYGLSNNLLIAMFINDVGKLKAIIFHLQKFVRSQVRKDYVEQISPIYADKLIREEIWVEKKCLKKHAKHYKLEHEFLGVLEYFERTKHGFEAPIHEYKEVHKNKFGKIIILTRNKKQSPKRFLKELEEINKELRKKTAVKGKAELVNKVHLLPSKTKKLVVTHTVTKKVRQEIYADRMVNTIKGVDW